MGVMETKKPKYSIDNENYVNDYGFTEFFNFCSFVLAYEDQTSSDFVLKSKAGSTGVSDAGSRSVSCSSEREDSNQEKQENTEWAQKPEEQMVDEESNSTHDKDSQEADESDVSSMSSSESQNGEHLEYTSDDESWNLVTCFCGRPFAGRPMIECSRCYVWIHLYCAKIKKDKVPDVFVCQKCKDKAVRRSKRKKH